MTHPLRYVSLLMLALTAVLPTVSQGQQAPLAANDQIVAAAPIPQDQLDALLAPIALYPDQLLAQVLMASTYPLDVVEAARFVQQNPSLTGDALDSALQDKHWDPSVLSLTAYPQVLLMMNDMLDWTQRLGNAFLANQQQVMDTVQLLRSRAQSTGNLQSTPQQTVMNQGGFIDIAPAQPQYVYVPVYDPTVVYGPWSDPDYIPPYWYPPPRYGYPDLAPGIVGVFFGTACWVSPNHWGWAHPNWRGRDIDINVSNNYFAHRPQYAGRWRDGRWAHVPEQRDNVASRGNVAEHGYARPFNTATPAREPIRTHDLTQPQQAISRSPTQPQAPIARPVQQPRQPMTRFTPVQEGGTARALAQAQQPIVGQMPRAPQPMARSTAQPAQGMARSLPPPQQPTARPMPRAAQPMARATAQPQPVTARSLPPPPPQTARPSWHPPTASPTPRPVQTGTRSTPRPPPAMVRSVPQPQVQRLAYNAPPQAHVQAQASHGDASRPTRAAPSMPAQGHR